MKHGVYARTTSGIMVTEEDIDKYEYSKEDIVGIAIISDVCNPFELVVDEKLEENEEITRELFDNFQDMTFSSVRGLMPHEALEIIFSFNTIRHILSKLKIGTKIFSLDGSPSWVRGYTSEGNPFLFDRNGLGGIPPKLKELKFQYLRVRELNLYI